MNDMVIVLRKSRLFIVFLTLLFGVTAYGINVVRNEVEPVASSGNIKKIVVLDPGHGGEDPGAVSDYTGIKEKDINLKIALRLREKLQQLGYTILMTREDDALVYDPSTTNIVQKRKQDLLRRKNIMDSDNVDVVVSIHLNKFPQTQYRGAQVFYPSTPPESKKLSQCIQKALQEIADPSNKREALLKKEKIIILKEPQNITSIVECGFLSNEEEEKMLANETYQEKISDSIKKGLEDYFKSK